MTILNAIPYKCLFRYICNSILTIPVSSGRISYLSCVTFTTTVKVRSCSRMTDNSTDSSSQLKDISLAKKIFENGVNAAIPSIAIRNKISLQNSILTITTNSDPVALNLNLYKRCFIAGFGKAVLPMAEELFAILGEKVNKCIVSVPHGTQSAQNSIIEICTGAKDNIPDEDAMQAAENILAMVKSCNAQDLLFVLISGGGSALLPMPKPPITLQEKSTIIKTLSRAGASIVELNTVRKSLSVLKGGGLVKYCPAGRIVSLILSDVLNDPLDIIGSGPTVQNHDDSSEALKILRKYVQAPEIPQSVLSVIQLKSPEEVNDSSNNLFEKVSNVIIGNNRIALKAAEDFAAGENLQTKIVTSALQGDARTVGTIIAEFALQIKSYFLTKSRGEAPKEETIESLLNDMKIPLGDISNFVDEIKSCKTKDLCLLLGGETTVNVTGTGLGGRNQELALASAVALSSNDLLHQISENITILCAGTDGIDGPCDAAGAVVNYSTIPEAKSQGLSAEEFLINNDSYNFFRSFSQGKYHIKIGHTGTNVMDLIVVIIRIHA